MKSIGVVTDKLSLKERDELYGKALSGPYMDYFKKLMARQQLTFHGGISLSRDTSYPKNATVGDVERFLSTSPADGFFLFGGTVARIAGLCDNEKKGFEQIEGHVHYFKGKPVIALPHPREAATEHYYHTHIVRGIEKMAMLLNGAQPLSFDNSLVDASKLEYDSSLDALDKEEILCFDIETPMVPKGRLQSPFRYHLRSIAFWSGERAVALSPDQFGPEYFYEAVQRVIRKITDPSVLKIGQNIFFDLSVMYQIYGCLVKGPVWDTMQVENVLNWDLPKDLSSLANRYCIVRPWKGGLHSSGKELRFYNAQDVKLTYHIYKEQRKDIEESSLGEYITQRRLPLFAPTFDMAMRGFKIDTNKRKLYAEKILDALQEPTEIAQAISVGHVPDEVKKKQVRSPGDDKFLGIVVPEAQRKLKGEAFQQVLYGLGIGRDRIKQEKLYMAKPVDVKKYGKVPGGLYSKAFSVKFSSVPRTELNLNSSAQIKAVMASMNFPRVLIRDAVSKEYRDDSSGSKALKKILATKELTDTQRHFILALISYRELAKVIGTYYTSLLDDDGRYRFSYNLEGAETGRSTSKKTPWGTGGNSQNFPSRTRNKVLKSYKFKDMVIAEEGKLLLSKDQKSAESVIVAHLARCATMLEEFEKEDPDFHTLVASLVYQKMTGQDYDLLPPSEQEQLRTGNKPISHGCSYGMYTYTLQEAIFSATNQFLPSSEVEMISNAWHKAFPEIKHIWHKRILERIKRKDIWTNAFGRKIQFRGRETFNSLNELLAMEPQGTVPDITNELLVFAYRLFETFPEFQGRIVQMGHDAVVSEVSKKRPILLNAILDYRASLIVLDLGNGPFSIKWDASVGQSWGKMWKVRGLEGPLPPQYKDFCDKDAATYTRKGKNV